MPYFPCEDTAIYGCLSWFSSKRVSFDAKLRSRIVGQSAYGHVTYLNVTKVGNKIILDGDQNRAPPICHPLQGLSKVCLL